MAPKKNGKAIKQGSLPKGYVPARQRLDGFFAREKGNVVQGILRGSFEVKGKYGVKRVHRIEIVEGETQTADGEMIGPGGIIGLDETGYTKALSDLDPGSGVYIRYEGKGEDQRDPHVFTVGRAE